MNVAADVNAGLFFLALWDGHPAGTIRYQLEDPVFWPDMPQHDSAFVHRLAVRRRFAGGEISSALLRWAITRTHALGVVISVWTAKLSRPRLRAYMNVSGFVFTATNKLDPTSLHDMSTMCWQWLP